MHDCLSSGPGAREGPDAADGATLFRRVLTHGEDATADRDAAAVAARLGGRGRPVDAPEAAELVALGSATDGIRGRVALGEAGRLLLERARCPVAVAPRGFAEGGSGAIRHIDVGIDGSREAGAALALAGRIGRVHDAVLRAIAVAELEFDLAGVPRAIDPGERARLGRHLDGAGPALPDVRVEAELHEGLADQILIGLAREADVLVLGSRSAYAAAGRVALGSVAARIVQGATCPTIVVPAP